MIQDLLQSVTLRTILSSRKLYFLANLILNDTECQDACLTCLNCTWFSYNNLTKNCKIFSSCSTTAETSPMLIKDEENVFFHSSQAQCGTLLQPSIPSLACRWMKFGRRKQWRCIPFCPRRRFKACFDKEKNALQRFK